MQKKIIFLDLDGVLNIASGPNATYLTKLEHFEEPLIMNLNYLLAFHEDLNIVLSSDWRKDLEDTKKLLKQAKFAFINRIIDITPIDNKYSFRGDEISAWLKDNNFEGKYLCIDDNITWIDKIINKDFCLGIDSSVGFNKEHLNYTINYFKD